MERSIFAYYGDIWSEGDLDRIEEVMTRDIVSKDCVWYPDDVRRGIEKQRNVIHDYITAYPNLRFEIRDVAMTEGNQAAVRWMARGHSLGCLSGVPATGKASVVEGIDWMTFDKKGRIVRVESFRQPFTEERARSLDWEQL